MPMYQSIREYPACDHMVAVVEGVHYEEIAEAVVARIGYAFASLAGEQMTMTHCEHIAGQTYIGIYWDSTKSRSDDIGLRIDEVMDNAVQYVACGSPVRKTDRAGAGTKGTQLLDGLGLTLVDIYVDGEEGTGEPFTKDTITVVETPKLPFWCVYEDDGEMETVAFATAETRKTFMDELVDADLTILAYGIGEIEFLLPS